MPSGGKSQSPSPQFQEMIKRLKKEHGGQLPPGLGAFTEPPPIPMQDGSDRATPVAPGNRGAPDDGLPVLALPRNVPQHPKGPSIPQIIEIQRQHKDYMKKKDPMPTTEEQKKSAANVDAEFRSPLVDPTVDVWIDQEIAKKSASFQHRLKHIYQKREDRQRRRQGKGDDSSDDLANNYDPDGTVFLSKVSNVLSTEHPDMGNRLDKWIDKQVEAAMSHHHGKAKLSDDDDRDDGDVWLQDAFENSEENSDSDGLHEALSRDFAKGIFYSSAKQNRREFGDDAHSSRSQDHPRSKHRRFKRRKTASSSSPSSQVFLQVSEGLSGKSHRHKQHWKDDHLFSTPVDHGFNWDPEDNRFRTDKDTNVQDPDYVDYPMHRVIDRHRRQGLKSKHAQASIEKWTSIATGANKDPLEDLFSGSKFNFVDTQTNDFTMDHILEALDDDPSKAEKRKKRFSDAWGV